MYSWGCGVSKVNKIAATALNGFQIINKLQGKRVLVFGGSSGFGLAVAEVPIEHGAIVAFISSNADKLSAAAARLKKAYGHRFKDGQISTFPIDLSLPRDRLEWRLKELSMHFTPESAKIDHVVFRAGDMPPLAGIDALTAADFTNYPNVRSIARAIVASVLHRDDFIAKTAPSSFILKGGTVTYRISTGMSPIAPLSGTVFESLCQGLSAALAPIQVNIVTVGIVDTPLVARLPTDIAR